MSDHKQNCLSFGQKRQIVCLLDEGVSHFVDRFDSFCTYLSSIVDSISNFRIHIGLIVVDLVYVSTSLCCLLSKKIRVFLCIGFFCLFSRAFSGAEKNDLSLHNAHREWTTLYTICYHITYVQ